MRKSKFLTLLTASFSMALLLAMAGIAQANLIWENEPNPTLPSWATGPKWYQRNIYWDFESDPSNKSNWEYEGYRDNDLKGSDSWGAFQGDMSWDGHAIGLSAGQSGSVTITLDNLATPSQVKRVYFEAHLTTNVDDPGDFLPSVEPETGTVFSTGHYAVELPDTDSWYLYAWYESSPNPLSEEIIWNVGLDPEEYIWFNDLHIATECIPVPGTLLILAPGLLGFVAFRRNRSRKTA